MHYVESVIFCSTLFERFIQDVVGRYSLFIFFVLIVLYYTNKPQLVHSSAAGHLSYPLFSYYEQYCEHSCLCLLLHIYTFQKSLLYLVVKLPGHKVHIHVASVESLKQFLKLVLALTKVQHVSFRTGLYQHMILPIFSILAICWECTGVSLWF